jgi:hypothetical protein
MNKLAPLVLLALSVLLQNADASHKAKFSAYVTCDRVGGFVDGGVFDSQKDLTRKLSQEGFRIASSPQNADIELTITSRLTGHQINSINRGISGGLYPNTPIVANWHYVFVHLRAGEFEKSWCGYGRFWKDCASRLADEINKFARANEAELLSRKKGK